MCEKLPEVGLNVCEYARKAKSHPGRLHGGITQVSGKGTVRRWLFDLLVYTCFCASQNVC